MHRYSSTSMDKSHQLVSWNRVSLQIPSSWQTLVSGSCHIIFENDFEALLEIRWQQAAAKDFQHLSDKALQQLQKITGKKLNKAKLSQPHKNLFRNFSAAPFSYDKGGPSIIFLYCHACSIFLMLKIYSQKNGHDPLAEIEKLQVSKADKSTFLWAIQDFRISIPAGLDYSGHSMQAGLTSLHFSRKKVNLHICRLAPASVRLAKNTQLQILSSLTGIEDIQQDSIASGNEVFFERSPNIARQVQLRLQRKKPFILAVLQHKPEHDRLLGVIMESTHPINHDEFNMIFKSYEISAEKEEGSTAFTE